MSKYQNNLYTLRVQGVWGRNRKTKRDYVKLGDDRALTNNDQVLAAAYKALADLKPKDGLTYDVMSTPCNFEAREMDGVDYTITTSSPFDSVVLHKGKVDNNGKAIGE